MIISGIRSYSNYNSINATESLNANEVNYQPEENAVMQAPVAEESSQESARESAGSYSAFDYAQEYDASRSYELPANRIEDLDKEVAVSAQKKSQLLQQYQFFAGNRQALPANNVPDMAANGRRPVEDFTF